MEESHYTARVVEGEKMPVYVRLKRRREEPPPAFLCVLPPQKRQQLPEGISVRLDILERALIFKHVDSAPPPVTLGTSAEVLPSQQQLDEDRQTHVSTVRREVGIVHKAEKRLTGETSNGSDQKSDVNIEEASPAVESTTFWSAFNTPLRSDVFGPFAGTEKAAPARLGYQDAVEEAVKSLRRFRVDNRQQQGNLAQRRDVLLHECHPVPLLDVYQDAATDPSGAYQEADEFEYDLYEIECDAGDKYPWKAGVGRDSHRQRLLELLEQDRSAVALVEVEDVDDSGIVTNRNRSMQVFLEEFGDIDDSESDEGGEIDYPSGESSVDGGRRPSRCIWDSETSDSSSDGSKSGEESFDDDCF